MADKGKESGKSVEVKFAFERSTKNKHRFLEVVKGKPVESVNDGHIGALYVSRELIGENPPTSLTVVLKY